ncbi:hypothetical protein SAY86_016433 [Trapa natans]|uniref:ALOG domain-containing protein n=1 Tax=Trapa natans TaxID=22666 RepID=A0AAN7LK72_TRANT|nr:hypothetical protein SAY86_016433 [Trapa natans]
MSAAVAAAAVAAALASVNQRHHSNSSSRQRDTESPARNAYGIFGGPTMFQPPIQQQSGCGLNRYESQKRRDWTAFCQYLRNHRPPLALNRCSGTHVLEFLKYLEQMEKTRVHAEECPFFVHPNLPAACPCPLRQSWGSLDALVGRLRAAFEESGVSPDANPFGSRAVNLYLREVRDAQAKARGTTSEMKKRR